jgi:uncharacterized protein YciI
VPLFVFVGRDGPDGPERRNQNRAAHVARLDALDEEGRIRYAGPIRNEAGDRSIGAVIVIEAGSLEEARRTFEDDPYVKAGVYAAYTIDPFKLAYPTSRT